MSKIYIQSKREDSNITKKTRKGFEKKWQACYIAPLQPSTLAAFRPWEGSTGAGRVRPAGANVVPQGESTKMKY